METKVNLMKVVYIFVLTLSHLFSLKGQDLEGSIIGQEEMKNDEFVSFYEIIKEEENLFRIKWGIKDSFYLYSSNCYEILGNGLPPTIVSSNKDVIILQQLAGQSSHYYLTLPLSLEAEESIYFNPISLDLEHTLIAYIPPQSGSFTIVIENILTETQFQFTEDNVCPAAIPSDCLLDSFFKEGYFILNWLGKAWTPKYDDKQNRKIVIPQALYN